MLRKFKLYKKTLIRQHTKITNTPGKLITVKLLELKKNMKAKYIVTCFRMTTVKNGGNF